MRRGHQELQQMHPQFNMFISHGVIVRPSLVKSLCSNPMRHQQLSCGYQKFYSKRQSLRLEDDTNWCIRVKTQSGVSSQQSTTESVQIVEYFILLQLLPDIGSEGAEELLSELWSLKYAVPNVLCASAGEASFVGSEDAYDSNLQHFTHVAKFRFGSPAAAKEFQSHEKFLEVSAAVRSEPKCVNTLELVAKVVVQKNLGDIFKSGGAWESGVEHILMARQEETPGTMKTLCDLAISGGALQSCSGSAVELITKEVADETKIIVSHFPSEQDARAFMGSRPVQILFGSCTEQKYFCFEIAPTDSKTQSKGPGGLV